MKKNTGKVLSLVLAMAMAASTFTATFASAATLEVDTDDARVEWASGATYTGGKYVSDKYQDITLIDDLDNAVDMVTMNRESVDDVEYLGFTKVSGESLLRVARSGNDNDEHSLILRKGASGEEEIEISYRGTYVDDETDRDVTVRGTINLSVTVYTQGEVMLAENEGPTITGKHPSAPDLLAVNDSGVELALYVADNQSTTSFVPTPKWTRIDVYGESVSDPDEAPYDATNSNVIATTSGAGVVRLGSSSIFNIKDPDPKNSDELAAEKLAEKAYYEGSHTATYSNEVISLPLIHDDKDSGRYYADPGTTTVEVYAPKITITQDPNGAPTPAPTVDTNSRGERLRVTVGVGRIWNVTGSHYQATDDGSGNLSFNGSSTEIVSSDTWTTIARIGSRTVIGTSVSSDDTWSDQKGYVKVISNYDVRAGRKGLTIENGNLGEITDGGYVSVTGGNIDSISATTISVSEATVGSLDASSITIDAEATVDSVSGGTVDIQGATVKGDVDGSIITINGDIDYDTVIGGNVTANEPTSSITVTGSEDEEVTIAGHLVADGGFKGINADIDVSGLGIAIGGIETDWMDTEITFDEFEGAMDIVTKETGHSILNLENGTDLTVNNGTYLSSVTVDDTSALTFNDTIVIEDLAGDGLVKVNPDSLMIKSGLDGVKIQLLGNPAVGDVVMRATVDTVAPEDINGIGFTTSLTHESSTVDRFTIDDVSFAGLAFAEGSSLEVSVGTTDTINLVAYPTGTDADDADIEYNVYWGFEGDDEYIKVTPAEDGTGTATVEVLKFNEDYAYSNRMVVTATLVDPEGMELEGYVPAVITINGTNKPASTVTLDTTTVTRQVGQIYQFIASSTAGGTITAASSDAAVATVALYDANDARGHKFQINAVGVGTATITATDVNGATASLTITVTESTGSLKMDTTTYTMAPGGIYDILVTVEGADVEPEVTISRDAIASLTALGEGKYRVTARNEGTTYVTATVTVNGVEYHTSVQINVVAGATASGVTGNNVTYFA